MPPNDAETLSITRRQQAENPLRIDKSIKPKSPTPAQLIETSNDMLESVYPEFKLDESTIQDIRRALGRKSAIPGVLYCEISQESRTSVNTSVIVWKSLTPKVNQLICEQAP